MEFVELEDAFAQFHIAIEQGDMLTDRLNQVIIDADRNIVACQGTFTAGCIIALSRVEDIRLYLCRKGGTNGIALFQEGFVQAIESLFTHATIRATHKNQVIAFGQFNLFARFISD